MIGFKKCRCCRRPIHFESGICPYCNCPQKTNSMYYYYENELYTLSVPMRETTFELLKQANPQTSVSVRNVETKKEKIVRIGELLSYSIYRNRLALGKV